MITLNRTFNIARRGLALSAFFAASLTAAQAQQMDAPAATTPVATTPVSSAQPALNLQLPAAATAPAFSSSSTDDQVATADTPMDFHAIAGIQPPPRRSYGRPRYRGGNTNPDGSNKYAFLAGAGITIPTSDTSTTLNPSWGFQVGAGRNFNKTFGVIAQFDWDNFGFTGTTLNNQLNLYNQIIAYYNQGQAPANQVSPLASLDGSTHVWSFSVNPTFTFYSGEGLGAYVVAGAGFYHKVANFTTPSVGVYCDPYYGCYQYQANQSIDEYTSNAPGFSGGFGLTYKMSRFSNERLYGEIRYVYLINDARPGVTISTITSANAGAYNDFPANSNRTSYLPVKFGIRF